MKYRHYVPNGLLPRLSFLVEPWMNMEFYVIIECSVVVSVNVDHGSTLGDLDMSMWQRHQILNPQMPFSLTFEKHHYLNTVCCPTERDSMWWGHCLRFKRCSSKFFYRQRAYRGAKPWAGLSQTHGSCRSKSNPCGAKQCQSARGNSHLCTIHQRSCRYVRTITTGRRLFLTSTQLSQWFWLFSCRLITSSFILTHIL